MNSILILSGCLIINKSNELLLWHRLDHDHYETPGGKIKVDECKDFNNPTIEELKNAAKRELYEELKNAEFSELKYFEKVEFAIPCGKKAIAYKFITKIIKGKPEINEPELFDKIEFIPIKNIERYKISPDLVLLTKKIRNYFTISL